MERRRRLAVVSNRLPSLAPPTGEDGRASSPVGGLTSALSLALEKRGGLWLGWSGKAVNTIGDSTPTQVSSGLITFATMDLTRAEANLFYNIFANRTLWPLLHGFPAKVTIRSDAYRAYLRMNRRYARMLYPLLQEEDLVWVHDYHLIPLGSELRALGWQGKTGFFLHTPFPPPETFTVLPWAAPLLEALLQYDLMGLHTRRYRDNLLDAVGTELGEDAIDRLGKGFRADAYPIGTDPDAFQRMADESVRTGAGRFLSRMPARHRIILGVDRLDYTKGILNRLLTFDYLLEHHPSLRGNVTYIQISAPSRSRVPEYVEEKDQVDQLVGRINGRFSQADWVPVIHLYRSYSQLELTAFYRRADVCLVTPLRDGMNLVAKEYVASQGTDPGVLVLSKFCGAAESMTSSLIVNPYDIEGTAEVLSHALSMRKRDRLRRWQALMQGVSSQTAQVWSDTFLDDLAHA